MKCKKGIAVIAECVGVYVLFAIALSWAGMYNFCYLEQWQTFVYNEDTICRILQVPGGVMNVAALWLQQFFVCPYAGVTIMALLLSAITLSAHVYIKAATDDEEDVGNAGGNVGLLGIIPACAAMVLHYNVNYLQYGTLSLLLAIWLLIAVVHIKNSIVRMGVALFAAVALYVVAGAVAMLFAVLVFINALITRRSRVLAVIVVLLMMMIGWVSVKYGYVSTLERAIGPAGYFTHRLPANPIVWMPWTTLAIVLVIAHYSKCILYGARLKLLSAVASLGFMVFCLLSYVDRNTEFFKELYYYMGKDDWTKVMERYAERPCDNVLFSSVASIAQIEIERTKGADVSEAYPVIVDDRRTPHFKALIAEGCYCTGQNGTAMHYAFEANQSLGNFSPRLLKFLVKTNIAMKEWDVALKYITILQSTKYYKAWADEQEKLIANKLGLTDRHGLKTKHSTLIYPDYTDVTVPRNIAPLRFTVNNANAPHGVKAVFSSGKVTVSVEGDDCFVAIGEKDWKELLSASDKIDVEVAVMKNNKWEQITSFSIHISSDEMDSFLAYRLIEPGYETWNEMSITQRCLENYDESNVLVNRMTNFGCMNCHSFHQQNPDKMLFHLRVDYPGTYVRGVYDDSDLKKLDLKEPLVYPSWHNDGKHVAFSKNVTKQIFHPTDTTRVEVFDVESDVVVANVYTGKVISCPLLSSRTSFETFPTFSADGKTLYFCSADSVTMPEGWSRVKYSLCSIPFDASTETFGNKLDTLFNAKMENQSVSFPRVSPDGRFLMFTVSNCGNFSIWHKEADLYLCDLKQKTPNFKPLAPLNSNRTESYHSWSSNGRWVVFSSRRDDGLYTRPYIAHIDNDGNVSKPFILPQRSKDYYIFQMKSYNIPEFVKCEVKKVRIK